MYIPFNSSPFLSSSKTQRLHERQARMRRNHPDNGDDSSGSDSNPDDRKKKKTTSSNLPYANTDGFRVSTYTNRKSPVPGASVIPSGLPFAGRMSGGSGREAIFGTRTYGSGYPSEPGRGTMGRGFPFFFWPISWPIVKSGRGFEYLHANGEYGNPTNTTRLGGPLMVAKFTLLNTTPASTSFRVLSDNATVLSLLEAIMSNCSGTSDLTSEPPSPFADSPDVVVPGAESVVQYYRASSIALTLDGYNNAAVHSPVDGVFDIPIPELDAQAADMMSCLNHTIGRAAPLVTYVITTKDINRAPKESPATTVIAVICSLFGFCIVLAVLMRCISIKRRRRATAVRSRRAQAAGYSF